MWWRGDWGELGGGLEGKGRVTYGGKENNNTTSWLGRQPFMLQ